MYGLLDLLAAAAATMLLKVQLQDQVPNFFSFASDELTREPVLQMQWFFKVNYGILKEAFHILQQIDPTITAVILFRHSGIQVNHC